MPGKFILATRGTCSAFSLWISSSEAEIAENDFNLNIPRYVDTFEEKQEIERLEGELAEVRAKMKQYLKELGL